MTNIVETRRIIEEAVSLHLNHIFKPHLTYRELLIGRLVARGYSSMEVGLILGRSQNTVRVTLRNIFLKLGLVNRTQLATLIYEVLGKDESLENEFGGILPRVRSH